MIYFSCTELRKVIVSENLFKIDKSLLPVLQL